MTAAFSERVEIKRTKKVGAFRHWERIFRYFRKGSKGMMPHELKQEVIKYWLRKKGIRIMVETGTFLGDMSDAIRPKTDRIYTIELDSALAENARRRFADFPQVHVLEGDSAEVLSSLTTSISETCLFWLDGHFSGGITAKGKKNTPISEEMEAVLQRSQADVILIDDVGVFGQEEDYPEILEIKRRIQELKPGYRFSQVGQIFIASPA